MGLDWILLPHSIIGKPPVSKKIGVSHIWRCFKRHSVVNLEIIVGADKLDKLLVGHIWR